MPTGIEEFYDPAGDDFANRSLAIPTPAQIPLRQVDPFISSVNRLQSAGLMSRRFADTALISQLRRSSFANTGVVPQGMPFEPGQTNVSEDDLRAFRSLSRHQVREDNQTTQFIPREHTDSSGFLRLLEMFSAFNFALAGAANALVNATQGEEEETNVAVEFWRGLTLKDKETFSNVFENMGWEGEDGFAYWSRATTGFIADVLLDPLNVLTLFSAQAGARALGRIGASRALRRGALTFANGERLKPTELIGRIGQKLSDEAVEAAKSGVLKEKAGVASNAAKDRARALALRAQEARRENAIRIGRVEGQPTLAEVTEDTLFEAMTAEEQFGLTGEILQDVYLTFDRLAAERNPDSLLKFWRMTAGSKEQALDVFRLMDVDPYIASTLMEDLLKASGYTGDLTQGNMTSYLMGGKLFSEGAEGSVRGRAMSGNIRQLFDPGGIKVGIPFTDVEVSIIESTYMDQLKLKMLDGFQKHLGNAARWLTSESRLPLVSKTSKAGIEVGKATADAIGGGVENVKRLFGVTRDRNGYINKSIKERSAVLQKAAERYRVMTEEALTFQDGTAAGRALTPDEQRVMFKALKAEEDAARGWQQEGDAFFDRARTEKRIEKLEATGEDPEELARLRAIPEERRGYEERHLSDIIRNDPLLAGHSSDEVDELLRIARSLDVRFRDLYDDLLADGLDVSYMSYYLPTQYKNLPKSMRYRRGMLKNRLSDEDPFTRVRKLRRSEAIKPEAEGGLGLVEIDDNLFGLVYQRYYSAERARIERKFVGKVMDSYAIHPGQVSKLLDAAYGPTGALGSGILKSIRSQGGFDVDLWTSDEAISAIPELGRFKDMVETGEFPEALAWLDVHAPLVNTALINGNESLKVALDQSISRGRATMQDYLHAVGTDYERVVLLARESLGGTADEVLASIRKLVGSTPDADVLLTSALAEAMEKRVRDRLNFWRQVRGAEFTDGNTQNWASMSKEAGDNAGRVFLLDEMLRGANARVTGDVRDKIEKDLGEQLDEWVDALLDKTIFNRSDEMIGAVSVRLRDFDQELSVWLARMLPVEAMEQSINSSGVLIARELRESGVLRALDEYGAIRQTGDNQAIVAKVNQIWEQLGTHPELRDNAARYRAARNLPEVPLLEYSPEARKAVVDRMLRAKQTGSRRDIPFFHESPFVPDNAAGISHQRRGLVEREVRESIKGMTKGDPVMEETLFRLAMTPNTFRSGYHWQPYEGVAALSQSKYGAQASKVVEKLKQRATASTPQAVLEGLKKNKIEFDWIARNLINSPKALLEGERTLIRAMTNRFDSVLQSAARRAGIAPSDLTSALEEFTAAINVSLDGRGFTWNPSRPSNITEAHEAVEAATQVFTEQVRRLSGDAEMGHALHTMLNEFSHSLIDVNQKVSDIYRATSDVRDGLRRINTAQGLLAASADDVVELTTQIETVQDEVFKLIESVEQRAEMYLHSIDDVGIGREMATQLLKDDPLVGNFWKIADSIRGDMNKVPKTLEKAWRAKQLRLAKQQGKSAEAVIADMNKRIEALRPAMEAIQEEARVIDTISKAYHRTIDRTIRRTPKTEWFHGDIRDIAEDWLQLAVSDEFLRMNGASEADWIRAVDKVLLDGPSDVELRKAWAAGLKDVQGEEWIGDIRAALLGNPLDQGDVAVYRGQRQLELGNIVFDRNAYEKIPKQRLSDALDAIKAADEAGAGIGYLEGEELLYARESGENPSEILWEFEVLQKASEHLGAGKSMSPRQVEQLAQRTANILNRLQEFYLGGSGVGDDLLDPIREALVDVLEGTRQALASFTQTRTDFVFQAVDAALNESPVLRDAIPNLAAEIDVRAQELLRTGDDASTMFEVFASDSFLQGDQARAAYRQLREERAWIDAVEQVVQERGRQLAALPGFPEGEVDRFLRTYREAVDSAWERLAPGVPELPEGGVAEVLNQVAESTESPILRQLAEGLPGPDLGPAFDRVRPWSALIEQLEGSPARARFWLEYLGIRSGDAATASGIPSRLANEMFGSSQKYWDSRAFNSARGAAVSDVNQQMRSIVTDNRELVENRFLAQSELEQFEQRVIPDLEKGVQADLQYGPDEMPEWRSVRQMQNYYNIQLLRAEHEGLGQILAALPSRSEVMWLKLRAERRFPEAAEQLAEALPDLRPQGATNDIGSVFHEEQSSKVDRKALLRGSVVAFEDTQAQWDRILSGAARRTLDRLGLDITQTGDSKRLRESLQAIGIVQDEASGNWLHPTFTTIENLEMNAAINEIDGYYQTLQQTLPGMASAPALESQVEGVNAILKEVSPDPTTQQMIIYAVTGRSRVDQLSALEAGQLFDFLGTRSAPEARRFGGSTRTLSQRDLAFARVAGGRLPRSVIGDEELSQQLTARSQDVGTPYEMVEVTFPQMGDAQSPGGYQLDSPMYVEKYVADVIEDNVLQDTTLVGPMTNAIRKVADPLTNWFKYLQTAPFIAFHVRNVLDATTRFMFSLTSKGWNMKKNWDYYRLLKARQAGTPVGKIALGGVEYDGDFLLDMFERHGGVTDFSQRLGLQKIDVLGPTDSRLHPAHESFFLRNTLKAKEVVDNFAGRVDNTFRFNIWIDGMEQGMPPAESMRRAQKFLFDYAHGLTPFEREWMRRIFPFYTFSRFNIPLMLETLVKHPGVIAGIAKTNFLLRDDDRNEYANLIPSFIREQWQMRVGVENGEMRVLAGRNLLAVEDLAFLGDLASTGNLKEGFFKEVFGRMNPMIKLPMELYVGKNFYFGNDIRENQALEQAVWNVPVLRDWLDLRQVMSPNGELQWRVNGHRWHTLQQTHFARLYRTLAETFGDSDARAYERLLPVLTGLRLQSVDLERRMNHLTAVSNFNQTKLKKALEQGDTAQIRQVLGTTERSPEEQEEVNRSFQALKTMTLLGR